MGSAILVVAETRDGAPTALTRELLGLAATMSPPPYSSPAEGEETRHPPRREKVGMGVMALLVSPRADAAADLRAHGADRVYWCKGAEDYEGETWLSLAEGVARETEPLAVLAGHTPAGADLAPRLAFRLKTGIATGCVGMAAEYGKLLFTRPCYGGNVRETVSIAQAPAVATVRAGVGVPASDTARQGEVVTVDAPALAPRVRVIAREREATDAKRLEDAGIIVAGGRGLEGPEGFRVLEDLARVLDAAVGSSRVPCDLGWCPHSWQIGLTGRTVTPDLYIAVGISGAGHHMAGCGNARTIVAINSDPEAAIFREARFGVVGDYREIVPALTAAVAKLRES
jgi:electron transfer flavoprotein alpha subunit